MCTESRSVAAAAAHSGVGACRRNHVESYLPFAEQDLERIPSITLSASSCNTPNRVDGNLASLQAHVLQPSSFMAEGRKLPGYVYLPPEAARRQAERTRDNTYKLISSEVPWKDRYHFLERNGFRLRPRYNPAWEPSWKGTNLDPAFCEDYIVLNVCHSSCLYMFHTSLTSGVAELARNRRYASF